MRCDRIMKRFVGCPIEESGEPYGICQLKKDWDCPHWDQCLNVREWSLAQKEYWAKRELDNSSESFDDIPF